MTAVPFEVSRRAAYRTPVYKGPVYKAKRPGVAYYHIAENVPDGADYLAHAGTAPEGTRYYVAYTISEQTDEGFEWITRRLPVPRNIPAPILGHALEQLKRLAAVHGWKLARYWKEPRECRC